jgi:SNF2 family DNA or RNA helicase
MGTGKTRTMIDGFRLSRRENPELKRMLVLAPPVVLPTWVNEVRRCSQSALRAVIWDGTDKVTRGGPDRRRSCTLLRASAA